MGRVVIFLTVLCISCGSTAPVGVKPPSEASTATPRPATASPSPLPRATPTAPPATPNHSPVAVRPLSTVDFSCVLPVSLNEGGRYVGSFISFPSRERTPAGEGGPYYDRAISRWLQVGPHQVAPDGLRYAYVEGSTNPPGAPSRTTSTFRAHIVDAASGADLRVVTMPDTQFFGYYVVDFTATAVYLMLVEYEGIPPGVWRVDSDTGAVSKVSEGMYERGGWIGVVDPRDPLPESSPAFYTVFPDRIDHRDAAGHTTMWFYKPGFAVRWIAFAVSPSLIVSTFHQDIQTGIDTSEIWLVEGPGRETKLAGYSDKYPPSDYEDLQGVIGGVADDHGIWFTGNNSLYLARPDGTILRVFDAGAILANTCV